MIGTWPDRRHLEKRRRGRGINLVALCEHCADRGRDHLLRPLWYQAQRVTHENAPGAVLTPNDCTTLDELAARIHAFARRYAALDKPFAWRFTRHDLARHLNDRDGSGTSFALGIGNTASRRKGRTMRNLIFGAVVGGIAAWLYRSQQARDQVRERLANAPAPVRDGAESLTAAAGNAAERAAGIIDSSALPRQVKDSALRVTSAIQSAAEEARQREPEAAEGPAVMEAAVADPVPHVVPDDVLAEEDAAQRAVVEARKQQQRGV